GPGPAELARLLRSTNARLRGALAGAHTVEIHRGIVPFCPPSAPLVWNGLVRIGDAAGHASTVAGEGIRLAMDAGSMAGRTIAAALFGGVAPGRHRTKPAYGPRWAAPAPPQAAAVGSGSVGGGMITKAPARFRPDVVAYYEETWLDFRVLWMTLGNPAFHFGYW